MGQKKLLWSFWDHFLASTTILYKIFSFRYRTLKIIKIFDFLTHMLRPLCACWAYDSGTDAYTEHLRQELIRALCKRVRNWCGRWAYASGTDACCECAHQELMSALCIHVKNWYARSACVSEIKWCLAPPKVKWQVNILTPKSSSKKGFMVYKSWKSKRLKDLGTFK